MNDNLAARFFELSNMQNIPSMAEYADAWLELAAEMRAAGRNYSADNCYSRYEHYKKIADGEYVKLIDPPFAELLEAS